MKINSLSDHGKSEHYLFEILFLKYSPQKTVAEANKKKAKLLRFANVNMIIMIGKDNCLVWTHDKILFLWVSSKMSLNTDILSKKRLWHRCFPVNSAKFLRTPVITEHLWWLLLVFIKSIIGFSKKREWGSGRILFSILRIRQEFEICKNSLELAKNYVNP